MCKSLHFTEQSPYVAGQSFSMIEDITMNSCLCHRSWQHQGKCGRRRHMNSISRMWRSNMRAIRGSTSSSGVSLDFSCWPWKAYRPPRYLIRVLISRRMADVNKEKDIWVHSFRMPPDSNNSIKMEVGIEDCLHIEFEYNKSKYAFICLYLAAVNE